MLPQTLALADFGGRGILFVLCLLLMACAATDTSLVTEKAKLAAVPTWVTTTEGDRILIPHAVDDGLSMDYYRDFLFPPEGKILRLTVLGAGIAVGDWMAKVGGVLVRPGKPVCLLIKTKVESVAFAIPSMEVYEPLKPGITVATWFLPRERGVFEMGVALLDSEGNEFLYAPFCKLHVDNRD